MGEKEEEKGRRAEKSGTISWGPHVMRFSLFTSMDTESPPTVFISSSLILLFSAVNLLSLLSRLFGRIPRHLHCFLISSFSFATSLPDAFFFFWFPSVLLWCHSVNVLPWIRVDSTIIISMQNGNLSTERGAMCAFWRSSLLVGCRVFKN